jgi:hypothetical protein
VDVRRRVGLPHDGQNFLEGSLHVLIGQPAARVRSIEDSLETCVTPQHPALDFTYPLPALPYQSQTHRKQYVLYSEIARHARRGDFLQGGMTAFGEVAEVSGTVDRDIGGCDPFASVRVGVVVFGWGWYWRGGRGGGERGR